MRFPWPVLLGCACVASQPTLPAVPNEVAVPTADVELPGSLILPEGDGPFPAVVGLVGSGSYSYRDAWIEGHWPFWQEFADEMTARGMAVLMLEKRGVQGAPGDWKERTLHDRADDALAAVQYLKTRPDIDGTRVGVAGQSQGGWVAQITAAEAPDAVAFLMTFAGPTIPVLQQVVDDHETEWRCDGVDESRIPARRKRLERRLKRFVRTGHLAGILHYDPADDLARIQQPWLAIYAEHDGLVWPSTNIKAMSDALRISGNERAVMAMVPGANHAFLYGERCAPLKANDGPPSFRELLDQTRFVERVGGREPMAEGDDPFGDGGLTGTEVGVDFDDVAPAEDDDEPR